MTWIKDNLPTSTLIQPCTEDCCSFTQLLHHAIQDVHGCASYSLHVALSQACSSQPYSPATITYCICAVHAQSKQCWRNEYQERWSQGRIANQQFTGFTAYRASFNDCCLPRCSVCVSKLAADRICQRPGWQLSCKR